MNNLNVAKIQLNGSSYEVNDGTNLKELLNKLKIKNNKVAIEVNGEIIEKKKYLNFVTILIILLISVYYIQQNKAELIVLKSKHYRHIFSRFDKLAIRYLSFLQFVGALIWLR